MVLIQSKTSAGFSGVAVDKLISVTDDLLDLSRSVNDLSSTYNQTLLATVELFRKAHKELASKFPKLTVSYYYVSKGSEIHPHVRRKVEKLKQTVKQLFSQAEFKFAFLGAKELLELARRTPRTAYSLNLAENPISSAGDVSFVCLVRLNEFYRFITDSNGRLVRSIFEANVRDYQGKTEVNEGIQETLKGNFQEEFWWLNNGVTILSSQATLSGKSLTIEDPQIVNGLQTSTEIYNYFKNSKAEADNRNLLVRVIVPTAIESRDRVIKATNSQTDIPIASLRATEKIHRDIEEYFRPHGFFYDRRKNFYKNDGKPIDRIISIAHLAQTVIAIALQRPDSARGKPSSLLKKDEDYAQVFSPDTPIDLYLFCVSLMKRIDTFLKSGELGLEAKDRNNLRFHIAMYAALMKAKRANPSKEAISKLSVSSIDDAYLSESLSVVKSIYVGLGGTDQVAKGPEFLKLLKSEIENQLGSSKS